MLYLIGLGLEKKDINIKALEIIKKCKKIYLEIYTTKLPYKKIDLEKVIKKKVIDAKRDLVESDFLIKEAKKQNIALLIYGDPLSATTHVSLMNEAKKAKVKIQIMHNTSIFNAISETGLHLYKFGKTVSIPKWKEHYEPMSFYQTIKENLNIEAHTLLLVDIDLSLKEALRELAEASNKELDNKTIIICSQLGTKNQKIVNGKFKELVKKIPRVKEPFCIIIPASLHFTEAEFLKI
ncbi:MAG: diphthine synthase [Candidatus Pacearchaeota archaeon]|nr:MAG: diphthine synthase [Candidatus Pacearchaeota archaeon]